MLEAHRFLLRPRRWVRELGGCITRCAGFDVDEPFVATFIRDSAEKTRELAPHGHGVPPHKTYAALSAAAALALPHPHVVVSTSSAEALRGFVQLTGEHRLTVAYSTGHARSQHDGWIQTHASSAGRGGTATLQATIAAVNLHLATRAEVFITSLSSSWTYLVWQLMDGRAGGAAGNARALAYLCCACRFGDNYGERTSFAEGERFHIANVIVLHAAARGEDHGARRALHAHRESSLRRRILDASTLNRSACHREVFTEAETRSGHVRDTSAVHDSNATASPVSLQQYAPGMRGEVDHGDRLLQGWVLNGVW